MKRLGALALAVSILLTGCSLYRPLPESVSPDEARAMYEEERRIYWRQIAPGEPYPEVEVKQVVDEEEGWEAIVRCVGEMGLPGVTTSGGGIQSQDPATAADVERAIFLCNAAYPVVDFDVPAELGYLSTAELEYLWTYFTRYLVPCMELHGYDPAGPPSRETFVGSDFLIWSPYAELARQPISAEDWRRLDAECAPPPMGDLWRPEPVP